LGFDNIIGHREVLCALDSALGSGKMGHAYLFAGAARLGKKTVARELARRLLCLEPAGAADCQCEACRRVRHGTHPDLITVAPDGNTIKIEQLRQLRQQVYFKPVLGRRRVFYFPEAEKLTEAAANSFLKTLEEAPAGVVFLFIAARLDYILPTIRSRCQVYNLFPVAPEEIVAGLQQRGITAAEAGRRAVACGGLPGLAVEPPPELTTDFPDLAEILQSDLLKLLQLANELEKKERPQILLMLQEWLAQARGMVSRLRAAAQSHWDYSTAIGLIESLSRMIKMVESNVSIRLALEDFFMTVQLK
jgi:DNA polymerase-3 subunit delta'